MITIIKNILELRRLRRNIWLSEAELREIQELKLKKIIKHAYENVTYYRKLFDSVELKPEDIKSLEDLPKIPITTKDKIKNTSVDELLTKGIDKSRCIKETTSGSTGKPLTIYLDYSENEIRKLTWLRIYFDYGFRFTDKIVAVWKPQSLEKKSKIRKLGKLRFELISVLLPLEEQVDLLRKARADVIYSGKSALGLIAQKILKDEIKIKKPKLVLLTGEVIDVATRKIIKNAFGLNPSNVYGTTELGLIAWECKEYHSMHINTDCVVTEFVKDGKSVPPGDEGVLIGTNLNSYVMPLIRYELGDICVLSKEKCSCGRQLPLIERIDGRVDDIVTLNDGSRLTIQSFHHFLRNYNEIDQYRIIQEDRDHIKVILVCREEYYERTIDKFKEDFETSFLTGVNFTFERVEEIPLDPSGKCRSIISKVKPIF